MAVTLRSDIMRLDAGPIGLKMKIEVPAIVVIGEQCPQDSCFIIIPETPAKLCITWDRCLYEDGGAYIWGLQSWLQIYKGPVV